MIWLNRLTFCVLAIIFPWDFWWLKEDIFHAYRLMCAMKHVCMAGQSGV